jgi:gliding motility-associated-like protein
MKVRYITLLATLLTAVAVSAQVAFVGNDKAVYQETPASSTGLNKIYVLYSTDGVSMTYTASSTTDKVTWYEYGEGGGGYAGLVPGVTQDGAVTTLTKIIPNSGYIIEEGTKRTYLWVVDYSKYALNLSSISCADPIDCGTATLNVTGSGTDIGYYTITGVHKVLDRDIQLSYKTLVWSDGNNAWTETDTVETESGFKSTIVVPAPLCNTTFTLKGDKFLTFWNTPLSVSSDTYVTNAVDVHATAVQEARNNDNEKNATNDGSLGGSAPVKITFTAYCTDAVTHKEWQMATDADFTNVQLSLNDEVVEQTFEDAGTFYWRFIGTNAAGTCTANSDVYTVTIGTSSLVCPNVFSPGSSEGVNDVWKVSYSSIISFKCWIFNRWGVQICELNDPSQGWDGKYKGKLVDSGVYYYVIEAKGSDGKKYKLNGDINIIKYKKGTGTTTGGDTGGN